MKYKLGAVAVVLALASTLALAQTGVVQSQQNVSNRSPTYAAAAKNFTAAATPTDVCILNGSATKTVYVTKVSVSGLKTTGGLSQVLLFKRSAANTGGTAVGATEVAYDSTDAAPTAAMQHYTANPTPGAGTQIYSNYMSFMAPAGTTDIAAYEVVLGAATGGTSKYVVLRGVAQGLAVNLDGATLTGGVFNCNYEWIEQ